jgi:hypothetical protein
VVLVVVAALLLLVPALPPEPAPHPYSAATIATAAVATHTVRRR